MTQDTLRCGRFVLNKIILPGLYSLVVPLFQSLKSLMENILNGADLAVVKTECMGSLLEDPGLIS